MKLARWAAVAAAVLLALPLVVICSALLREEYAHRTGDYSFFPCAPDKLSTERAGELFKTYLEADEHGLYRFEERRAPTKLDILSIRRDETARWPSFQIDAQLTAGRYVDAYQLLGNGCGIEHGVRQVRKYN